jgi:glycosyltransferase involved in cell wall biosynthesis
MTSRVASLVAGVRRRLDWRRRPQGELLLVVDRAGWILDEIADQLRAHLPQALRCRPVSAEWVRARGCTIHFINRVWAWSDGPLDQVDDSNRLIGVWWHGRHDSPDPATQDALRRLGRLHHRFARLQASCSIARRTLEIAGVPPEKIVMLPIGVDRSLFQPRSDEAGRSAVRRALGVPEQAVAVGCFQKDGSGWDEDAEPKLIKGPDILVDALVKLNARYPLHAVIPGPARGYVKRRLAAARVRFSAPGMVSREALPPLYHALDIYLSPSRDEGGPAGVLEAMASGVPVVSSRAGIPVDLIEQGVNGLLVDVGDAEALAAAAAELIERPSVGAALAEGGLASIAAYDWRVLGPRYASELYAPVSGGRR